MKPKLCLLLVIIPFIINAQKNYTEQLDRYMQAQEKVNHFSGTVLVMSHGKKLLEKGYGMADREWNIPNSPDGKFRIGSITKQFTATCILQLAEQHQLSLEDKLSKYIPDFPKGDSVSIRMLLNHTSGIKSYTSIPEFTNVERASFSEDSIIKFFKYRPYDFSPGTQWAYDNSGYFLLGYIIQKVSGEKYADYLRKHIFNKTGMNHSGADDLDSILPMRTRGYSKHKNGYANAMFISMEWPFSAGVIYSTVGDLYKWDRALYGNSLLSEVSKKAMFTPFMEHYGFGLIIDTFKTHQRIWHNGGIPGFVSHISRFINDDLCVIVLSNNESRADNVGNGLASIVFNLPVTYPYVPHEVTINPAILSRYAGSYQSFSKITLIIKEGKLFRHTDNSDDIQLKPESDTKFYYADGSGRGVEFQVDASGKVLKSWFISGDEKMEMKKLN